MHMRILKACNLLLVHVLYSNIFGRVIVIIKFLRLVLINYIMFIIKEKKPVVTQTYQIITKHTQHKNK